jgi:Amt family ammonium transporter
MIDFAGSTVVHSVGGWAALAGAMVLGPRIGRYARDGRPAAIPGHSITLGMLGVFILWLGWFGFNAGSTVSGTNLDIATIAVTTNLAAAAGALVAMFVSWMRSTKPDVGMTGNGAIAGLVAITAPCEVVSPASAIVIGAIAGLILVYAVAFFDRLRIDDPVGAISVHGVCGAFGTLSAGVFAQAAYSGGSVGLLFGGGFDLLLIQLVGVVAVFAFVFPASYVMFKAIDLTLGLRVSPEEELDGLDVSEHGLNSYPDFEHIYNPLRR